ncbi:unnamed protein product [Rotaria magnacalcarata]|uniref:Replication-associated protein n=1 Tax=Rotaria magnacalcarata TaxID=392030 RepID=A0A8S2L4G2_9BILA|nr:unnamed protein product [Rotaria magnacalcarata]
MSPHITTSTCITIDDDNHSGLEIISEDHTAKTTSTGSLIKGTTITRGPITQFHGESWTHPYPPIVRSGLVLAHDLPYFEYKNMDRAAIVIAKKFQLPNLEDQIKLDADRMAKCKIDSGTFAISCWSNSPKEEVLDAICRRLKDKSLKYVCVANEREDYKAIPRLHIQILLRTILMTNKSFMNDCIPCGVKYKITRSDRAWNEYLKKGCDFVEFGSFESSCNSPENLEWPEPKTKTNKRKAELSPEIATEALQLSGQDYRNGLNHIMDSDPPYAANHLMRHEKNFRYADKRRRTELARQNIYDKEFCWGHSFPNCTLKLKDDMDDWLYTDFKGYGRSKALALVGGTGLGKTSFALSLNGVANHCRGAFDYDQWNDDADYIIFDDIPWSDFRKNGYPSKRSLLTGQNFVSHRDYKGKPMRLHTQTPIIVLLNPDSAGPLLAEAITPEEIACKAFWDERITVRVMGPGEYFYKPEPRNSRRDISSSIPPHMIQFREFQDRWLERRQSEAANQTESSISVSPKVSTTNNNILVIDLTSDSHLAIEATTATNLDVYAIIAIEILEIILTTLELVEGEI